MIFRFILYGLIGIAIEIVWTAFYDKVFKREESWDLKGTTYVWMIPIYGLTVVFYEPMHNLMSDLEWYYRGSVYMIGIFIIEYIAGYYLKKLGHCPWDYTMETKLHLHGLIRFDYAPVWFMLGLILEPIHDLLIEVTPLVYSIF
ncbi:MAG: putative ABC transporter permease [Candidatus Njordarchaeales archaeon]